mmetsp:Transcript_10115/g.13243  ORF Transcript_10115/g.13243 Transcript_10115/m.13243 type:complete len:199 (+) Transcript_10115:139-735(+)
MKEAFRLRFPFLLNSFIEVYTFFACWICRKPVLYLIGGGNYSALDVVAINCLEIFPVKDPTSLNCLALYPEFWVNRLKLDGFLNFGEKVWWEDFQTLGNVIFDSASVAWKFTGLKGFGLVDTFTHFILLVGCTICILASLPFRVGFGQNRIYYKALGFMLILMCTLLSSIEQSMDVWALFFLSLFQIIFDAVSQILQK